MRSETIGTIFILRLGGVERDGAPPPAGGTDNYPPYDIERFRDPADGRERLRLVLAVAGFAPDQLEIVVTGDQLSISGQQPGGGGSRHFLHRGIAGRRFRRVFKLADDLEVERADVDIGLLRIDLAIGRPDRIGRTTVLAAGGR